MAKQQRTSPGNKIQDPSTIANHTYNEASGAQKNTEVGRKLRPLNSSATAWTTDATTVRTLPSKGRNLAVYNNAGAVGSVTLGFSANTGTELTPVSQAPGAVQANTAGQNVGIACAPNDWTYIACGDQDQVISSAATLLVYLIEDSTSIVQEAVR